MNLYCDVDEVLLRWFDGYRSFAISKGFKVNGKYPSNWSFDGWVDGDWKSLIWDFNSSDFFHHLLPYDDSVPCLKFLHSKGWIIKCISSCSDNSKTVNNRILNLNNYFGDIFDEVICLAPGEKKKDILSVIPSGVWVEDNFDNALAGFECGHKTFLVERDHNLKYEHSDIIRVKDWHDIVRGLGYEF